MERFDNLTLDPTSPDFVARRIGDQFEQYDTSAKRLKLYGEYPNNSKFVRVDMNADVEAGATDAALLPFGYYGPPRWADALQITGSYLDVGNAAGGGIGNRFIYVPEDGVVSGLRYRHHLRLPCNCIGTTRSLPQNWLIQLPAS